mmetsp:Transcript_69536/g.148717  ORF Transcript_69536/g.148717 Transcript_69536/m.148717 type:complete len:240 (+) Transcript_69536:81-800(+)
MVKQEVWIPPYDEWAKESELTHWFGKWRDEKSALGFDFLYQDKKPRHTYTKKDDWGSEEYPVEYGSAWAKGRQHWEIWLDAYDSWDHEVKRLCEVYARISEPLDAEEAQALQEGKFPQAPKPPPKVVAMYTKCKEGDIVGAAELLEDDEVPFECKDENLKTPLMFAAAAGSVELVEYLVDIGADITCEDYQKETALDHAVIALGERFPNHPVITYLAGISAPRGQSMRSKLMPWLSSPN